MPWRVNLPRARDPGELISPRSDTQKRLTHLGLIPWWVNLPGHWYPRRDWLTMGLIPWRVNLPGVWYPEEIDSPWVWYPGEWWVNPDRALIPQGVNSVNVFIQLMNYWNWRLSSPYNPQNHVSHPIVHQCLEQLTLVVGKNVLSSLLIMFQILPLIGEDC